MATGELKHRVGNYALCSWSTGEGTWIGVIVNVYADNFIEVRALDSNKAYRWLGAAENVESISKEEAAIWLLEN